MKMMIVLFGFVAALSCGAYDFYNIMPYSPGREKALAADCVAYAKKTGNAKILYSLTLHPEGRPAMAKAEVAFASYRALREALKGTDVELGILIQAIIGHWPRVDKDIEPWMRTVNLDGEVVRFCPLDPGFAAYIRGIGRRCAAERPFFILTDDDVRAFSHRPECFCERHRKLFSERIGRDYTSDGMRQAVKDCHPGDKVYETFVLLQREMVDGVVRLVREGIDSVDPSIPAGVCMAGEEQRYCGATARAIAAKGQRPVMRLACANYCEVELRLYPWNVLRVLSRAGYWEDAGIDLLDESDTYPHNYWSKTALAMHTHQVNAILAGMKGSKLWLVGAHKQGFPVNPGYTEILAENAGFYRTLAAAAEGSRFLGLVAPCQRRVPDGLFPTVATGILAGDSCVTFQAGQYGVPIATTYDLGRRDVVYSLSAAKQVDLFNDEELRTILAGRVLVDGDGALALAKRGFADLLGCDVEPGAMGFTREQDAATGRAIVLAPVDKPAKLTAHPGARVLSWLVYSPYYGSPTVEKLHPGALVFTNRLGGVVVTAAFQHETPYHHSYSESRKRWFVDCMDALNGGFTPFVCGAANPTCAMAKRLRDGNALVAVVNTCFEGMKSLPLRLPADVRRVEQLLPDGSWKELPFVRDADGYADLPIALPCYGMAVVRVSLKGVIIRGLR